MGEDANEGNCNQRHLIVGCWPDLIEDVQPMISIPISVLHDSIVFTFAWQLDQFNFQS